MDKLVFKCNVCNAYLNADRLSPTGEVYLESCKVCQELDWKEMDVFKSLLELRDSLEELEKKCHLDMIMLEKMREKMRGAGGK